MATICFWNTTGMPIDIPNDTTQPLMKLRMHDSAENVVQVASLMQVLDAVQAQHPFSEVRF